jgi:beta-1,4-mannosyl-glycoprotein beta-1,4-N-acetylglucosaminyltransferase
MIYDCFTFRDELDILEIRLKILDPVVDKFVICEANKTFTDQPKPYTFIENYSRFRQWENKIIYLPIELEPDGMDFSTRDSQYNPTSPAWQFEYQQRNALVYGLDACTKEDCIMMGDMDEIPNPKDIRHYNTPTSFAMDLFYFFVNNKSIGPIDSVWSGTTMIPQPFLSQISSFQELRNLRIRFNHIKSGWHLSYMGGKEMIRNKIKSFSHTEYNSEEFYGDKNIESSLKTGKDIFHRPNVNFQIINAEEYYPSEILTILKQYPNLFF